MIDHTNMVYDETKKMNYQDLPDQVQFMMKTIKDNDVIDHVDAV